MWYSSVGAALEGDYAKGVAAVINGGDSVLLERRAIEPGYGLWALPGGMAEPGESTQEALGHEGLEETGLNLSVGRLLDVKGGLRLCIVFYEAMVLGGSLAKSHESLELRWFPRQKEALLSWLQA